jgi:ribonuclease HI
MAISDMSVRSNDHTHDGLQAFRATTSTVVIFTDCQAALSELQKLQNVSYTEKQLEGNAVARRIITTSQYLQRVGVHLEIRWIPGHAGIQGNCYADTAARAMARSGAKCEEEEPSGSSHMTNARMEER